MRRPAAPQAQPTAQPTAHAGHRPGAGQARSIRRQREIRADWKIGQPGKTKCKAAKQEEQLGVSAQLRAQAVDAAARLLGSLGAVEHEAGCQEHIVGELVAHSLIPLPVKSGRQGRGL